MKTKSTWQDYERAKKLIQAKNLSPKQYQEAIKKLVKRMGI